MQPCQVKSSELRERFQFPGVRNNGVPDAKYYRDDDAEAIATLKGAHGLWIIRVNELGQAAYERFKQDGNIPGEARSTCSRIGNGLYTNGESVKTGWAVFNRVLLIAVDLP